jgi:hypothetical protein
MDKSQTNQRRFAVREVLQVVMQPLRFRNLPGDVLQMG